MPDHFPRPLPPAASRDRAAVARLQGFTLIELLVVIGIIALLAGILIPVVKHVRIAGYETATKAEIQTLQAAIEQYHNTFNYYPGPIANRDLINGGSGANLVTGTENLTLGIMGGLQITSSPPAGAIGLAGKLYFVPADVGQGPMNLNPAKVQRYPAVIDAKTANLQPATPGSTASWQAGGGDLLAAYGNSTNPFADKPVPEFLDRFPDPLPILYIRANVSALGITYAGKTGSGSIAQYNRDELAPYNFPEPNMNRVNSAYAATNNSDPYLKAVQSGAPLFDQYFGNAALTTAATPYQKDGYILISAGKDRIYMSLDDLCNFGSPK